MKSTKGIVNQELSGIWTSVENLIEKHNWKEQFEEKKEQYNQYLKEKKIENLDIDIRNITTWNKTIIDIDKVNVPKYDTLKKKIDKQYEIRQSLLCLLDESLIELHKERLQNSQDLKQRFPDMEFEVSDLDNGKLYSFLDTRLQGLGIYKFNEQISRMRTIDIGLAEFIAFIENRDIIGLTLASNITETTSEKIIDYFNEPLANFNHNFSAYFMELQEIILDPTIKLTIIDKETNTRTNFMRLSDGKKCSYLLSTLLSSDNCPLIIDQPEDSVDSEYVQTIIDALRSNKGKRQFIIVTHNQNITVLGDSEKVIKVRKDETVSDPDQGEIVATGGVEREIVRKSILSLEGGPEAFKKRAKKYGYKLS